MTHQDTRAAGLDSAAIGSITLTTVTHPQLAGQIVTVGDAVRFASVCVVA